MLILTIIYALADRIRGGGLLGLQIPGTQLTRAIITLVIAITAGLFSGATLVAVIVFWGLLWASYVEGVDPEVAMAESGIIAAPPETLQPGLQWLSTKLVLPTGTTLQNKLWGTFWTGIRFLYVGAAFAVFALLIGKPIHALYALLTLFSGIPHFIWGWFTDKARFPSELTRGAWCGFILSLIAG